MKIAEIIQVLDELAPASYQESYDNAGLITGNASLDCTGIICTLDSTFEVILEAKNKGCNLIVAHHPIIFGGLKKITGNTYVERSVIAAIKNDITIYASHTNLDNLLQGVNGKMADKLGLQNRKVLLHKQNSLMKQIVPALSVPSILPLKLYLKQKIKGAILLLPITPSFLVALKK